MQGYKILLMLLKNCRFSVLKHKKTETTSLQKQHTPEDERSYRYLLAHR